MPRYPEIHVDDTSLFRMRALDNGEPFDPSDASVAQLLFRLPGGGVIVKDATITTDGSPATEWYLEYQVVDGDGLGSPAANFLSTTGKLIVQFYVEWADGRHYHSNEVTVDTDGKELRVFHNLEAS